ncbi:MAG: tetratricopeptide repeat protein [Acidobacteria bacterium]|nr:tetratricopeptide repeat protein [Acidobacteriota bacterium]MYE43554.1 tetratricopeptide repeat protein [Acidobacteriota bacterium]
MARSRQPRKRRGEKTGRIPRKTDEPRGSSRRPPGLDGTSPKPAAEWRGGPSRSLWLGAAAAVLIAAFFILRGGGPDLPDPPDPDLSGMEPEVAEVIRRARTEVLDDRESPDRWAALGAALLAHELHSEAAAAYTAAGALAADDYRFPYLRARSLWRPNPELAEAAALEAIGLNPSYIPAYLLAGQIAEDRADPETAKDHYRTALERLGRTRSAPANTAAASFRLGRLLAGDGNLEEALPLLEQAEGLAPESGAIAAALARVYRRTGDGGKAQAAAERARSLDHDLMIRDPLIDAVNNVAASVIGKERRAFAAEGAGRPEVAERLLREMIRSRPDAADLYYNLGNNLSRQGRNEEALAAWATALEKNPDHVAALINSSIVLAQSGSLGEAERRCLHALEIQPNHPGALSSLGSIAALGGRRADALRWFRRALEQEPERAGTHDSIAQVLAANRQFADAIRHFRIAVGKEPFRGDYRLGLAATLASTGDFEGAWAVAHDGRRLGIELPANFLGMLRQAMPEPAFR